MATNLNKINIPPRNPSYRTKKLSGLNRDGSVTDNLDFFNDSIKEDWWTFLGSASVPLFNEDSLTFSIGVRSDVTCTGTDQELEQKKQEYLSEGIKALFDFYGKDYNNTIVNSFATELDGQSGANISSVIDYHLSPRPSSKLKFLIEVSAEYLNALPDKPPPSSFSLNLNDAGDLIVDNGLLNPSTDPQTGALKGYNDISIVTLEGLDYEAEVVKTSLFLIHMNRDMNIAGVGVRGVDLYKEAERLKAAASIFRSYVAGNFSVDGLSNGKSLETTLGQLPVIVRDGVPYKVNVAFKENADGLYEILWASLNGNDKKGDIYLNVGLNNLVNSDPLDNQSTLRYLYFHKQILNNLDKNIELNFVDFLDTYHYPKIKLSEMLAQKTKEVPFETNFAEKHSLQEPGSIPYSLQTDPDLEGKRPVKRCGLSWPGDLPNLNFDIISQLQELLEPLNFQMELKLTFFHIGPPCPVPVTGDTIPGLLKSTGLRLKERAARIGKNIDRVAKEAEEDFDYVGDYFTSEEYLKDLEKRFGANGSFFMKMRQLGDMVLNEFGLDKMLKLVCICITQLGDELLEQQGIELSYPNTNVTIKGPGVSFDPSLLSSDSDDDFNISQALQGSWGEFQHPVTDVPFQLEQLCSFCIDLPDILSKLPTFDLLAELIDLILALLESLIVNLLMQLVLALIRWLQRCPDYQCEVRPRGGAMDDYGSIPIPGFFPDSPPLVPGSPAEKQPPVLEKCIALNGIAQAVGSDELAELQALLLDRMSRELSSGEMLNLFEGYPTTTVLYVIKEIIDTEQQFIPIKPFLNSISKIQDFCDCLVDNLDPNKIKNLDFDIRDPDYCPDPVNSPANYLQNKCNNEEQVKRFLINEKSSKAARLNGIIRDLQNNNEFFQDLMPPLFSTVDPDTNEKKPGLLADDKYRPPFLDTMIEQYDRFMDEINTTARREGPVFLRSLYQDSPPNTSIPGDRDLETNSTLNLTTALTLLLVPTTIPIAVSFAPWGNLSARTIDTNFPVVGGIKLRDSLRNIEANSLATIQKTTPLKGSSSIFENLPIPNKSSRQFNSSLALKDCDGKEVVQFHFESLTDTLKADGDSNNTYRNHFVLKAKSPELFGSNSYYNFSARAPLAYGDGTDVLDPVVDLDLPPINQLITTDDDIIDYSPQGIVFSQLFEKEMGDQFSLILPHYQEEIRSLISSKLHMKAFTDVVHKLGIISSTSPYFKTYTYEDIQAGVGSSNKKTQSYRRFGRYDSYFDYQLGPTSAFKQKFRASDKAGRTNTWWRAAPAIQDTPLRDGRLPENNCLVKYLNVDQMKQNIKKNWDPMMQYDPNDINSLPPLSVAILDELIPETIKFYCLDSALKSMPVKKVFKDYGLSSFRDELYSTLVATLISNEIQNSAPGTAYYANFLTQINNFWERRYKEDESLDVKNAPKNLSGIKKLVENYIEESFEKAATLTQIKHLNEDDVVEKNPLQDLVMKGDLAGVGGSGDQGVTPDLLGFADGDDLTDEEFESILNVFENLGIDPSLLFPAGSPLGPVMRLPVFPHDLNKNSLNASNVLDLPTSPQRAYFDHFKSSNGFVFEGYIVVDFEDDVKSFISTTYGDDYLDALVNGKHTTRDLKEFPDITIGATDEEKLEEAFKVLAEGAKINLGTSNYSILKHFLTSLSVTQNSDLPSAFDKIDRFVGTGSDAGKGIFKSLQYRIRTSFIATDANYVEEMLAKILQDNTAFKGLVGSLAGEDELAAQLKKEMLKNKNFIFQETLPVPDTYTTVLSLPFTDHHMLTNPAWSKIGINALDQGASSDFQSLVDQGFNRIFSLLATYQDIDSDPFNDTWNETKFTYTKLHQKFKGTKQYEALFGYALPISVATNLVSVFSFITMAEGLQKKDFRSFKSTKELFKMFFLIASNRSGFDGKPTSDMSDLDLKSLIPDISSSDDILSDLEKEKQDKEKSDKNCPDAIGPSSIDVLVEEL